MSKEIQRLMQLAGIKSIFEAEEQKPETSDQTQTQDQQQNPQDNQGPEQSGEQPPASNQPTDAKEPDEYDRKDLADREDIVVISVDKIIDHDKIAEWLSTQKDYADILNLGETPEEVMKNIEIYDNQNRQLIYVFSKDGNEDAIEEQDGTYKPEVENFLKAFCQEFRCHLNYFEMVVPNGADMKEAEDWVWEHPVKMNSISIRKRLIMLYPASHMSTTTINKYKDEFNAKFGGEKSSDQQDQENNQDGQQQDADQQNQSHDQQDQSKDQQPQKSQGFDLLKHLNFNSK